MPAAGDGVAEGSTGSQHVHAAPVSLVMRKYFHGVQNKISIFIPSIKMSTVPETYKVLHQS